MFSEYSQLDFVFNHIFFKLGINLKLSTGAQYLKNANINICNHTSKNIF